MKRLYVSICLCAVLGIFSCDGGGDPVDQENNDTKVDIGKPTEDTGSSGEDAVVCTPVCAGKECGDNQCGGTCGACPAAAPVCEEGTCVNDCTPDCTDNKCGDDGCGGSCGSCDDGLICTVDSCTDGACGHLTQTFYCLIDDACVPSGTISPFNPCEACQPNAGQEQWATLENGTPCGGKKVCFEGTCCDPAAICDGLVCGDDGCGGNCDACPDGFKCQEGVCTPDCVALCAGLQCGPAGQNGECECGTCDDGDVCTDDSCLGMGICQFTFNQAQCDDGNQCTGDDTCKQGQCGGELLPLEELQELDCICTKDSDCKPLENSNVCDGNLVCDKVNEEDETGICQVAPETILVCADENPCTDDSCNPLTGCVFGADNEGICADDNICNGLEYCDNGVCKSGEPLDCDDSNPCTIDDCSTQVGCMHGDSDNGICSDGDICNGLENCSGGQCQSGLLLNCNDNDKCTVDQCDAINGCFHTPAAGLCDDGIDCTKDTCSGDTCNNVLQAFFCLIGGVCVPSGAPNPDNSCQTCKPNADAEFWTYVGDGMQCDPGMVCYQGSCCDKASNCAGKECGSDGCGGLCGSCLPGSGCQDGICVAGPCDPICGGKECGPNGCGGVCGTCPDGNVCSADGQCLCLPACNGKECGPDGCGSECGLCQKGFTCKDGLCDENPCEAQCLGKECGSDDCGGICGSCPLNHFCSDGACICLPSCAGKQCGDNGCGGYCGVCPVGYNCLNGLCKTGPCEPDCDGKDCGPDGCGNSCGTCGGNDICSVDGECICFPQCDGKQCGVDGCGATCGSCPDGLNCVDGICGDGPCEPECAGKDCGPNGCGDVCGTCEANEICNSAGECFCIPDCADIDCGDDGCGGSCGSCDDGFECGNGGQCVCAPDCDNKECGDDGCDGSCGSCNVGYTCLSNTCVEVGDEDSCVGHCGDASSNCYCDDLCFVLDTCCDDVCTACPELEDCNCGNGSCEPDLDEDCDTCAEDCACEGCANECVDGECISTLCLDKDCGDDGCGGSCGECNKPDAFCVNAAACVFGTCMIDVQPFYCVVGDSCVPSGTENPDEPCQKCITNDSQVGWSNLPDDTDCGNDKTCYEGKCCNYDCEGKQCGDDGCGGSCGTCIEEVGCSAEGLCNGCDDGNDIDWDGCTDGIITEFQVNAYWVGDQSSPAVAALNNDSFVVAWRYNAGGNNSYDVHYRVFDKDANPLGVENLASDSAANEQRNPDIMALQDGGFLIMWRDNVKNASMFDLYVQRFSEDGQKIGEQFIANIDSQSKDDYGKLLLLESGDFIAFWLTDGQELYSRKLSVDGNPLSLEVKLVGASGMNGSYDVVPLLDGGCVVSHRPYIWQPGWKYERHIRARRYTDEIVTVGDLFPLTDEVSIEYNNLLPSIAMIENDVILAAWTSDKVDEDGYAVVARRTTLSGDALESEFLVNTTTTGQQQAPDVAVLSNGTSIITWRGKGVGEESSGGVFYRLFDEEMQPMTDEKRVNHYSNGDQSLQSVVTFSDDTFMVVYHGGDAQDGSSAGIFAQRFNSEGHKLVR
jgi:hypothetical protein